MPRRRIKRRSSEEEEEFQQRREKRNENQRRRQIEKEINVMKTVNSKNRIIEINNEMREECIHCKHF